MRSVILLSGLLLSVLAGAEKLPALVPAETVPVQFSVVEPAEYTHQGPVLLLSVLNRRLPPLMKSFI